MQGSVSLSSLTAGTYPVEAYVPLSVLLERVRTYWSIGRSTMMNRDRVSSGTCHSRAPHVAVQAVPSKPCTRIYNHTPKNMATHVHTSGVSNAYSRICMARARVHGWVGTEKQHRRRVHGEATECVVFMGRQWNASCSSGGNGMRRVHREATERVGANRLERNSRWKRGLAYRRTEETALCSTGHVRNGILFIGRGLAYRKTEETDFLRSKWGSC